MSQPAFPGRLNREDPSLTERQRRIFATLLALHSESARPVGSESLATESGLRLSAAAVRTELAELETLGLLERAHASAGRVPSPRGYEFFVRQFVTPAALPTPVLAEVDASLRAVARDVERLLAEASRLVSQLTHQVGLAQAASLHQEILRGLELTPLDERRLLLVLRLGGLALHTLELELESPLDRPAVATVESVLRERLLGLPLAEVQDRLSNDPDLARHSAVRSVARAAAERWTNPLSTPLFSAGTSHFVGHPEFSNVRQLRPVLEAVESGTPLGRLMVESLEGHATVRVGLDEDRALAACSLVSFVLPGAVRGAIGVLGPLRMDYALAFAAVDAVGTRVAEWMPS